MTDRSDHELEALAALYALGDLHGAKSVAFEALLQDAQSPAGGYLRKFQEVVAVLSWNALKEPPQRLRSQLLQRAHQERRAPPSGQVTLAPGVLLVLADQLAWQEAMPGIRYKPLYVDSQRRYASLLVTMAPGTTYSRHRHTQLEELFMLSGDIRVGDYRLRSGDYSRAEAGTLHEAIYTETGCTCIVLASLDDEFLPEEFPAQEVPLIPPVM